MQRHFSNRGEALAEVTAARMLAKRRTGKQGFITQPDRGLTRQKWFSERLEKLRTPQKPDADSRSEETAVQV